MRIALIVLLAVAIGLFLTNPGPEQFQEFVGEEVAGQIAAQNLPGGGILGGLGGQLAGRLVRQNAHRQNYGVFSVYTLDLDGPNREGEEWRFLGIASQFVELERPQSLRR